MKFLHLSDLHIGKRLNEFSMLEDQKYILSQILEILDRENADGVILAGDIYDKPIPSVEAVQLFDSFLTRLADRKVPVFAVSGNHDSVERVSFGAQLMENRGVYISRVYDGTLKKIEMSDKNGEVCIWLLPFIKPSSVRHVLEEEEISTYQDALKTVMEHISVDTDKRNILVAHQFVTGASRCESEEVLVGGVDQVDVSLFEKFDYVALGHLHTPQHVGRETVRYCGTPLKYSFSETDKEKSVTVVELGQKGSIVIRTIPLHPIRDMRKIRGTYLEVTEKSFYEGTNTRDYLHITLTDEEDIPDGMQKLRIIYPNLMKLEYDNRRTSENRSIEENTAAVQKTELEIFEEFFEIQNNQPMSEQQRLLVQQLIQEIQEGQERGKDNR